MHSLLKSYKLSLWYWVSKLGSWLYEYSLSVLYMFSRFCNYVLCMSHSVWYHSLHLRCICISLFIVFCIDCFEICLFIQTKFESNEYMNTINKLYIYIWGKAQRNQSVPHLVTLCFVPTYEGMGKYTLSIHRRDRKSVV